MEVRSSRWRARSSRTACPPRRNRAAADAIEAAVRAHGAVPATVAVLDGHARVGLSAAGLDRVCGGGLAKLSARDLGVAVGAGPRRGDDRGRHGRAGARRGYPALRHRRARRCAPRRPRVLGRLRRPRRARPHRGARGLLGGEVDPGRARDARGAGDGVGAGAGVPHGRASPASTGGTRACPCRGGSTHPPRPRPRGGRTRCWAGAPGWCSPSPCPPPTSCPPTLHDRLLAEGLALVAERGVTGKDVTPTLLAHFHAGSGGASLATNLALVVANAALAAQVAVALAGSR